MTEDRSDEPSPERAGASLLDLRSGQCRFVLRDGQSLARFCGEPTAYGESWCARAGRAETIGPAACSAAHNGPLLRDPILLDQLAEPECLSLTRYRLEEVRNRKLGHLLPDHVRMLV